MSHTFQTAMPDHPPRQKHGQPKTNNTFAFLRSLDRNECADVDLTWRWNSLHKRTREGGGAAMALHYPDPARNGYRYIQDARTGRTRPMTNKELHRTEWTVAGTLRWRKSRNRGAARPHTYAEMLAYVKRHGGTVVGELKSQAFAVYGWIMDQLVATARVHNHAPWFKALFNMRRVAGKCAATVRAGGQFALIFGKFVRGRAARVARGQRITAQWTIPPTRIW